MNTTLGQDEIIKAIAEEEFQDDVEFLAKLVDDSTTNYDSMEKVVIEVLKGNDDSSKVVIIAAFEHLCAKERHNILRELKELI